MYRIKYLKLLLLLLFTLGICACSDRTSLAPVVESHWRVYNQNVTYHRVLRGETLYAIAFRYDEDYRSLAVRNHLRPPYTLRVGQVIHLLNKRKSIPRPVRHYIPAPPIQREWHRSIFSRNNSRWLWPAKGRIVASFVPLQGKKGIDIAGAKGEPIYASANGVVAYAGNGLAGYGNLIIIKHDNQYLTAYGNNARNLVAEGQTIRAGQKIAEMGIVDRRFFGLHFEIRKAGEPVNPMSYLGH